MTTGSGLTPYARAPIVSHDAARSNISASLPVDRRADQEFTRRSTFRSGVGEKTMEDSRSPRLSRRQAISLLGTGAGLGLFSAARPVASLLAASPWQAAGSRTKKVTFPKGAVIRTILRDLPPEALSGSILFHEHLDGVYSRTERQLKLPPPSTADIAPVIADIRE